MSIDLVTVSDPDLGCQIYLDIFVLQKQEQGNKKCFFKCWFRENYVFNEILPKERKSPVNGYSYMGWKKGAVINTAIYIHDYKYRTWYPLVKVLEKCNITYTAEKTVTHLRF